MEILAGVFVTLVTALSSVVPQANLPQVLGVAPTYYTSAVLSETDESTQSATNRFEKRSEALEAAKERRQEALEEAKLKRANALERAKDAREKFKTRLQTIKNERKQKTVEGIDQKIATHNTRWVNHWNEVLGRLREIVAKIQTNADRAEENGKDISGVENKIGAANAAIESAQAAVNTQAGKTYTISITSENNLREDVQPVIEQFKEDVKTVLESVKTARKAVQEAFKSLRDIHGTDAPKTSTESGDLDE